MADLRDRIIDIINNQVGKASIDRELQEKYKILYNKAGVAELNDELNFLIHTSLVECGNDYKKYSSIILTAHARIYKNIKNTIITNILYWKFIYNLPSQYLQDISIILNTKEYPPPNEIITAVHTHLTNTVNYTQKPTTSANPKISIQLNIAVKDQKRRGEQLSSPPKKLETDNANPQPQRYIRPAHAHYKKCNKIHRKHKDAPY